MFKFSNDKEIAKTRAYILVKEAEIMTMANLGSQNTKDVKQRLALYEKAISICPDYSEPYYLLISHYVYHGNYKRAFEYFSMMKNVDMDEADAISFGPDTLIMLVSIDKKDTAYIYLKMILDKFFSSKHKEREKVLFVETLKTLVEGYSMCCYNVGPAQMIFDLLKEVDSNFTVGCEETLDRIKKYIAKDKKWRSAKTDNQLMNLLHKALALKFHPDRTANSDTSFFSEKIMKEVNQANSEGNLQKLKEIAELHLPGLKKYWDNNEQHNS